MTEEKNETHANTHKIVDDRHNLIIMENIMFILLLHYRLHWILFKDFLYFL